MGGFSLVDPILTAVGWAFEPKEVNTCESEWLEGQRSGREFGEEAGYATGYRDGESSADQLQVFENELLRQEIDRLSGHVSSDPPDDHEPDNLSPASSEPVAQFPSVFDASSTSMADD